MRLRNFAPALAVILLSACSTTQIPLTYTLPATATVAKYNSPAVVGEVTDNRKYTGTALGSVRNGFGARALVLELDKPASDTVREAVGAGMKSRGMLASGGNAKYVVNIDIIKLDCNKYARREAHISWLVSVVDKATNKVVYNKPIIVDKVNGSYMEISFSQTDQLKAIVSEAMQEAVDKLVNDPEFSAKFK